MRKKIVLFASGSGSNVENCIQYFNLQDKSSEVVAVFCNNKTAYVIERVAKYNIPVILFTKDEFTLSKKVIDQVDFYKPDLIVLLGFLLLVPRAFIQYFPEKIINLHPALLPHFGGKGMYGLKVHQAVKESGVKETGITIHYVNEQYDEGKYISQFTTPINENDTVEDIASAIHLLEQKHVPETIAKLLSTI